MGKPRERDEKTVVVQPEVQTTSSLLKEPYVIVLTGGQQGKTIPVPKDGALSIGRGSSEDLRIESTECSRQHSKIYVSTSGVIYIEDLGSTNGTFVNGKKISEPVELLDGDRINIGNAAILKFSLQDAIEEKFQSNLYESATRDALTGIFNKKYFLENLEREFRLSLRAGTTIALIMYDLDHFKSINDTYGHLMGDEVLKVTSKEIEQAIRAETVFCRYGGEEFAIILPNTTLENATQLAERLRESISNLTIAYNDTEIQVQMSLGVAASEPDMPSSALLVSNADQALYEAKRTGRNKVCRFKPPKKA